MPNDSCFRKLPFRDISRIGLRAALVLSFLLPLAVHAQLPSPADSLVVPGARLRLRLADSSRSIDGRLREQRGDTLIVEHRGMRTSVPVAQVAGVQVQRRAPTLSRNVTIGGGLGVLGGAGMYIDWCTRNRDACRRDIHSGYDDDPYDHEQDHVTLGVIAVLGGALLGGAVGYALTPVEWVDVDAPLRVGVTPGGRIGISGSFGFR